MLRRGTFTFTALLLLGASSSKSAALHFEGPPALYDSGHEVRDVAVGDFDGDGRQDAVTAGESGIVFFRGRGDGTLSAPVAIAGPEQDRLLAVDLDRDGHTDLIAWYRSSNVIWLFRGSNSGLVADTSYSLGAAAIDLKAGDLNGDGVLDLLVSERTRVEALLGTTGGQFGIPQFAAVATPAGSLALEDLNGDGRLDFTSYGKNQWGTGTQFMFAFGFGTGGFSTTRYFYSPLVVGMVPGPLVAADVTGDRKVDLAYTGDDLSGAYVRHLLMVQPGMFGAAVTTVISGSVSRMMARDLDRDGRADLLLAIGSEVQSLMGHGDGSFTPGETAALPAPVTRFSLGDLDGDGIEDLVAGTSVAYPRHDALVVLRGRLGRAPVARCRDVVVQSGPGCVAEATIDDGSSDPDGDPITVTQSPAGPYPLGVTRVTLTCADGNGVPTTCAATVTVVDATPPSLSLAVDRSTLWPPNNQWVPVHVTATSRDECDERPSITLASIVNSDPDPRREAVEDAAIGTADFDFELRAERGSKDSPRAYTICYDAKDATGNDTRQCIIVPVQKDLRAGADGTEVLLEGLGQADTFSAVTAASPGRGLVGLRYSIPHAGYVRLSIYDVAGHRVARPIDGPQAAGWHQASFPGGSVSQLLFYRVEWDGRSVSGRIPFIR